MNAYDPMEVVVTPERHPHPDPAHPRRAPHLHRRARLAQERGSLVRRLFHRQVARHHRQRPLRPARGRDPQPQGPARLRRQRAAVPCQDNATVINERIYLDKADANLLHDDITVMDHALTRPFSAAKKYSRAPEAQPVWLEFAMRRRQPSCAHRQGELLCQRGRLSDAGQEGSGAAGLEVFQQEVRPGGPPQNRGGSLDLMRNDKP